MRLTMMVAIILLTGGAATADVATDVQRCKQETDSLKRLTCYDLIEPASETSLPELAVKSEAPIKLSSVVLRQQAPDYNRHIFNARIELVPTFKNDTKKTVVAIEHTLVVKDAFGETIIDGVSKLDVKIQPGKTGKSDQFYFWDDNQFMQSEPYDRLVGPVSTGTAKATLEVKKAVFSDGTSEAYR